MKPRLSMISILCFCSLISACGPKHLGPELTKEGVSFTLYAPEARSVAIAGTFNAWDIHKNRLSGADNNGVWNIIIPLPEGRYEYLFIVDGKKWQPDPSVPEVDDGFGGKNSVLIVPEGHAGL
jgi:1,4-alpha-glucan branching enzyme